MSCVKKIYILILTFCKNGNAVVKEKNLTLTYWPIRAAQMIQSSNERQVILLKVFPLITSEMQLGR